METLPFDKSWKLFLKFYYVFMQTIMNKALQIIHWIAEIVHLYLCYKEDSYYIT